MKIDRGPRAISGAGRVPEIGISRRALLGGALSAAVQAFGVTARAVGTTNGSRMPVLYLSHGAPRLPIDPVRSSEIKKWGARLPKPLGIVVMTPHFGSRRITLGPSGRGFGMYNMPQWLKNQLPQNLDYPSPSSESLARRVERLLAGSERVARSDRRGFDHTSWMPLLYLYSPADVPVLEVAYPYRPDRELFALGQKLAPLRDEGYWFLASGQLTHNLATLSLDEPKPVPAWSREFDAWGVETLERKNVDALIDWRHKAPAAELAHPDDGGHFRVLIVALGVALAKTGTLGAVHFPVSGFESTLSKRCVELGV